MRVVIFSAPLYILGLSLGTVRARAQDTVFFAPTNRIVIRDMRSVPAVDLNERLHIRTVVGATGSVSFGELDSGAVAAIHHHTREQVDVTLSGHMDVTLGVDTKPLPPGYAVVIPADVNHSFVNPGPGHVTAIEFHTVPRPDLVPPRPKVAFPSSPNAAHVPNDRHWIERIDTQPAKKLSGTTCFVRWQLVGASVDVHPAPTPTELFVYVARGEMTAEGRTELLREGSLVILSASLRHAQIRSLGRPDVCLIEFQVRK